jgi:hypothetical protein
MDEVCAFLQVELNIEPGQSLGLMIRGGVEYNLGIFITGVDKDSVADRAGLMVSVKQCFLLTSRKRCSDIIQKIYLQGHCFGRTLKLKTACLNNILFRRVTNALILVFCTFSSNKTKLFNSLFFQRLKINSKIKDYCCSSNV